MIKKKFQIFAIICLFAMLNVSTIMLNSNQGKIVNLEINNDFIDFFTPENNVPQPFTSSYISNLTSTTNAIVKSTDVSKLISDGIEIEIVKELTQLGYTILDIKNPIDQVRDLDIIYNMRYRLNNPILESKAVSGYSFDPNALSNIGNTPLRSALISDNALKWSNISVHLVKELQSINEVNYEYRKKTKTDLYGRI